MAKSKKELSLSSQEVVIPSLPSTSHLPLEAALKAHQEGQEAKATALVLKAQLEAEEAAKALLEAPKALTLETIRAGQAFKLYIPSSAYTSYQSSKSDNPTVNFTVESETIKGNKTNQLWFYSKVKAFKVEKDERGPYIPLRRDNKDHLGKIKAIEALPSLYSQLIITETSNS